MTEIKEDLINRLYDKFNKALPKKVIGDCLIIIIDSIVHNLMLDQEFSVENFGTFSTMKARPEGRKFVRFYPHVTLQELIEVRFAKRKKTSPAT